VLRNDLAANEEHHEGGTNVIDRIAAAAIENVLVYASGLNRRPSCDSMVKIGRNDTVMISRLKNSAGPTRSPLPMRIRARLVGRRAFQMFVRVLDHKIAPSIIAPIAMAIPRGS